MTANDEIELSDINPEEWFPDKEPPEIPAYPKADERLDIMNFGGVDARISVNSDHLGKLRDRVIVEVPFGETIEIQRIRSDRIDGVFTDKGCRWTCDRDYFAEWLRDVRGRIVNEDTEEEINYGSDG